MSKHFDFDKYFSCTRKIRYGHRQTAKKAVVAMRAKGVLNLEAYPCRHCDGFHIGHKPSVRGFLWRLLPQEMSI